MEPLRGLVKKLYGDRRRAFLRSKQQNKRKFPGSADGALQERKENQKMELIGIIGAMDQEVRQLADEIVGKTVLKKAGMEFIEGELCGKQVVVVVSGIGKVNAGICTQILADVFEVDCVINTGVAGSLRNEINIGDIVVSTDAVQHDMDVVSLGYEPGQIPGLPSLAFKADEKLVELACEICRKENPDIQVFKGRVASGDQFISDKETKDRIIGTFDASCAEMEGASIAQAAVLNGIPYVVLRAISDKADGSAHMDYPAFEQMAIKHSINLVHGMLRSL